MSKSEREKLKTTLVGYRHFNTSLNRLLTDYGLIVTVGKCHVRVIRADGFGGSVTLSKTPSDCRTGLNSALQVIRLIETRGAGCAA